MKLFIVYIASITLFFTVACRNEVEINLERARIELQLKIDLHTQKKMQECISQATIEAENYVDSVIMEWHIRPINDTIYKPQLRQKPDFIPVDSSVFIIESSVKPILDES